MTATASAHASLASLVGRLTEPQDRDTYAALLAYFDSLPPGDELFRLAELLGLLSLLGQRVPAAAADLLSELRAQAAAAAHYHARLDDRLGRLPDEITGGVDVSAIAKAMAESVRQLVGAELQDTAVVLDMTVKDLKALTANTAAELKPLATRYWGISAVISTELGKLSEVSLELQQQNARLIAKDDSNARVLQCLLALLFFLLGVFAGFWSTCTFARYCG